jgi:hypothetical protein
MELRVLQIPERLDFLAPFSAVSLSSIVTHELRLSDSPSVRIGCAINNVNALRAGASDSEHSEALGHK